MQRNIVLMCTPLIFYTRNDEELLFNWIDKVCSVTEVNGVGEVLYLSFSSSTIPNNELLDLMGIFDRYKFDQKQLLVFMNETNKEWFE